MKEIICVTHVWTGMRAFFYEGIDNSSGMPAFYNVFKRLLLQKDVIKVHLILFTDTNFVDKITIPEVYREKVVIHAYSYQDKGFFYALWVFLKTTYKVLSICKKTTIIKIVGMGGISGLAGIWSLISGIPNDRRIYGTFLINRISSSKIKLFFSHPLEYLAFSLPAKNVIITNDGTKGDIVYKKLGNKNANLNFYFNGVDVNDSLRDIESEKYFTYIARIDNWKQQHLLIQALAILKTKNIIFPKVYIIGAVNNQDYFNNLKEIISDNDLDNFVVFLGPLTHAETQRFLINSLLTFSLYNTSNLGNVFIEALALGVPIVALNDTGSLKDIPDNCYFPIIKDDPQIIANKIHEVLSDNNKLLLVSKDARKFSKSYFLSWEERANKEIKLFLEGE